MLSFHASSTPALTCPNQDQPSLWSSAAEEQSPLGPPVRTPFVILFDGSAGSSWFADSLDRHAEVFIAGYEPLEWVGHAAYEGANATAWQPTWLHSVWHHPAAGAEQAADGTWAEWRRRFYTNVKLDPSVHYAPLTVREPQPRAVLAASAVGFKVRPATLESNALLPTLRDALHSLGGVVLTINRRDKVRQAVSLYRRRFEGKASQFAPGAGGVGTSATASHVSIAEMQKLIAHREEQEVAIECALRSLRLPSLAVHYEELQANFTAVMGAALRHLRVGGCDAECIGALNAGEEATPPGREPSAAGAPAAAAGGAVPAAGSTSTSASAVAFKKGTPSSLCTTLLNFHELCTHYLHTPHQPSFEPHATQSGCRCPDAAAANGGGAGGGHAKEADVGSDSPGQGWRPGPMPVVGTHHKTGTVLMGQVLRTATHRLEQIVGEAVPLLRRNWSECEAASRRRTRCVCLLEHARWHTLREPLQLGLPFVHMLRDPVEVCVSGYQYHLTSTEAWLAVPNPKLGNLSWQRWLVAAEPAVGLVAECIRGLPELMDQAELHVRSSPFGWSTPIKLEYVSANYSSAMATLFAPLLDSLMHHRAHPRPANDTAAHRKQMLDTLLKAVSKYDLSQNAPAPDKVAHVSDKGDKQRLRRLLLGHARLFPVLARLRQLLGYEPGVRPEEAVEQLGVAAAQARKLVAQLWEALPGEPEALLS